MKFHYRAIVQYRGTRYVGWQVQTRQGMRSIQEEIYKVCDKLSKGEKVRVIGASRTDSGVHALGQVCKISLPFDIPIDGLEKSMNSNLPDDILIKGLEKVDKKFHPIADAKDKEYFYLFSTDIRKNPFYGDLISYVRGPLNIDLMREACEEFMGEHDFQNFYTKGSDIKTTVRTIFYCGIEEAHNFTFLGMPVPRCYVLRVRGSGFLKQMIRLIMGALWQVGQGGKETCDIVEALNAEKAMRVGPVAPGKGLFLNKIIYLD